MVLTHVVFKSSRSFLVDGSFLSLLGVRKCLEEASIFLQDVKSQLKDIVHFEGVAETLFLGISIYVAESLTTCRMFDSH